MMRNHVSSVAWVITEDPDIFNEDSLDPEIRSLIPWSKKTDTRERASIVRREIIGKPESVEVEFEPKDYDYFIVHTHPSGNLYPSAKDLELLNKALEIGYKGMAIFSGDDVLQIMPKPHYKSLKDHDIRSYIGSLKTGNIDSIKSRLNSMGLDVRIKSDSV